MAERWEQGQKPVELPNPELNPLQNATLGRHLGRWAQVYFTSPPEKREQAVGDLLRELEAETAPASPQLDDTSHAAHAAVPSLICGLCQQPNELDQRFCGLCGSPLRGQNPQPGQGRPVAPISAPRGPETTDEDGLQWLREKSLSRLSDSEESSGKWKYVLVALAIVLAALGGLQWFSNRPAAVSSPAVTSSMPVQTPPTNPAEPPVTNSNAPLTEPPPVEPATLKHLEPAPTGLAARPAVAAPSKEPGESVEEGGAKELYLAQGYLGGKHGRRDSTEAAKWLWKAVAKQNTTADVLLSDLYVSGDGVAKSCDQARLLLVAATQKGAPTAAEKLRSLESGGCR